MDLSGGARFGGDMEQAAADQALAGSLFDRAHELVIASAVDGNPSAAPLLCARDGEDLVFLNHRASRIAAQLSINPRVQAILRGDEATAGLSLEIGGFCAEVADAEQRQRLVALLASAHDDVDRMLGGDTAARIRALEDAYP